MVCNTEHVVGCHALRNRRHLYHYTSDEKQPAGVGSASLLLTSHHITCKVTHIKAIGMLQHLTPSNALYGPLYTVCPRPCGQKHIS